MNKVASRSVRRCMNPPPAIVQLSLIPSAYTASLGETFALTIRVDAGAQPVDAIDMHMDYDTTKLKALSITAGTALPVELPKSIDNSGPIGTVCYSTGRQLTNPPLKGHSPSAPFTSSRWALLPVPR